MLVRHCHHDRKILNDDIHTERPRYWSCCYVNLESPATPLVSLRSRSINLFSFHFIVVPFRRSESILSSLENFLTNRQHRVKLMPKPLFPLFPYRLTNGKRGSICESDGIASRLSRRYSSIEPSSSTTLCQIEIWTGTSGFRIFCWVIDELIKDIAKIKGTNMDGVF